MYWSEWSAPRVIGMRCLAARAGYYSTCKAAWLIADRGVSLVLSGLIRE